MVRGKLGVLLILSSLVLCQAGDILTPGCIDYPNPIENSYGVEVNCNRVKSSHKFYKRCNHSKAKKSAPFILDFKCAVENDQCQKVRHSLDTAFELITNVIVLEEPVMVNVSFVSFCKELNIGCGDFGAAGAANPARSIPHVDSDGVTRMYPQALIKQMKLKEHPEYSSSDINAFFNSDANFWFM
ncbi:hypothetical protein K7432_010172 [Basidiobolus ranarum]|uniref:Uncharacterized protein n=1 Tax=Basidiobolus ranarum TaxID=34480 RepID=A0ABR2WP63_9FUNG